MYEAPYHHLINSQSDMIIHPGYVHATLLNDIGLIRTPQIIYGRELGNHLSTRIIESFLLEALIGPVTLPRRLDDTVNLDGYTATTSGFGSYSDEEEAGLSAYLLYVSALLMSNTRVSFEIETKFAIEI